MIRIANEYNRFTMHNGIVLTEVGDDYANERRQLAQLLRYSVIVVSAAPMLMIYPFLQKYFDQGVMIGSVKG